MPMSKRFWHYCQQHRLVSILLGHACVLLVLIAALLGSGWGSNIFGAFAATHCASGDQTYVVRGGDTLSAIATSYHTEWQQLASYNHIANPNVIYIQEIVCIPGAAKSSKPVPSLPPGTGSSDPFPYGQCTWWASHRYFQLHGVYVPWASQSNAWQWTARAQDFHWRVSARPSSGAIVDLQPWVQGAFGLGHVAVVEQILSNGDVIASNMNWGASPWQITDVEFVPGPGVSFITF